MGTMIRPLKEGGFGSANREVENITGCPPADGLLADMLLTDNPAEREVLAKKVAASIGRAVAAGHSIITLNGMNVAATRSGVAFRGAFADELLHASTKAMLEAQAVRSAQAIERVKARIDFCKAYNPGNLSAMEHCLEYGVEDDLGRFSDADYEAAIPGLVEYAGIEGERAERLVRHLQVLGRIGRDGRKDEARRDYQAEWKARAALRLERKQAGLSCFASYDINPATGRAVADEDREADDIAQVDAEIVEAALKTAVGNINLLAGKGAPPDQLLIEAFVAGFQTRNCRIDVDVMVAEIASASANLDAAIVAKAIEAGRGSAAGTEAELAFSRFLTHEGLAAPAPRSPVEPAEAIVRVEAPSALADAPPLPAATSDDAAECRALSRAVAEIKANRNMPSDDMLAIVRRVASEAPSVPADRLADIMISTSLTVAEYTVDAIRFSIDETRRAGAAFDDAAVAIRVEMMLKGVHAPITGQPGVAERNAAVAAAAMSPIGAKGPTPFVWKDPHTLPRRAWLYGTLYIRKELTATIAPGGGGKTALTIVEALALASGRPLLGVLPAKRCRVWIWSGEEPLEELQKRILAACEHHGLNAADIDGWLFVDNFESFDFIIAEQTRDGTTVNQPKVDLLIRWIANNGIDVLFIDPAISTHNVGENDNVAVQKWATAWKSVAVGANAAISLAHHAKKLGGQTATSDDSRGARSFVDKCRVVRSLNPMTKDEAGRFQIPEEDRRYFFSIDPTEAKANMAPAVGGKEWFQSHSVMLGVGQNGNLDPGESVGVVGRWKPPAPADKLDGDKIEAIRKAVGGKSWRAAALTFSRPDSIGAPIAEVFGLDLASPADRRRANAIYGALLKQGVFVEEKVPDENYKLRPFARLAD